MNSDGLRRRLEALREKRAKIDLAIEQLEAQIEAQEVESARGGGSYVLQKVLCGKPSCHCTKPGGELHGPYWYYYCKKDGKTRAKMWARTGRVRAEASCQEDEAMNIKELKDQGRVNDKQ